MPVSVLIVDDSGFFRHRIEEMLKDDPRLSVVGTAVNGKEAVELAKRLKPDVVTMDVEMPQMNGIEAVRIIMREAPTNVLMLSSLTHEGARVTLQALEAGAADYLPKDIRAWMDKGSSVRAQLIDRLVALGRSRKHVRSSIFDRGFPVAQKKAQPWCSGPSLKLPAVPRRHLQCLHQDPLRPMRGLHVPSLRLRPGLVQRHLQHLLRRVFSLLELRVKMTRQRRPPVVCVSLTASWW